MDIQTDYIRQNSSPFDFEGDDGDGIGQRLDILIRENAEFARERQLYSTHQERFEAWLIENPISTETAFQHLGLMMGVFLPGSLLLRMLLDGALQQTPVIAGLFLLTNVVSAVVGYHSGKMIGRMVEAAEKMSWTKMLLLLPLIGILWGIITGGAGGFFMFGIGAIFGAIIAAAVAAPIVLVFTIFHRILKRGNMIARAHFLPLAAGVTFVLTAYFLGL